MNGAFLLANAAEEGKNVILSMLVVGLVFLLVIAIGEWIDISHRRRRRRVPTRH